MGVVLKFSNTNKQSKLFIIASGLNIVYDVTLSAFFHLSLDRIFWDFLQDKDQLSGMHASVTSGLSQCSLVSVHRGEVKVAVFKKYSNLLILIFCSQKHKHITKLPTF